MRRVVPFLTLMLLLLVYGCSGNSPAPVAEKAVNALLDGDMESYYELLTQADQAAMTKTNFVRTYHLPDDIRQILEILPEAKDVFKASKFKETVTGDNAVVTYVVNIPDADKIGSEVLSLTDLMSIADGGKVTRLVDLPEDVKQKIVDYVHKNGVPTKEVTGSMDLLQEEGEWRVNLNLVKNYPNGIVPKALILE